MKKQMSKCCANCANLVGIPRKNRYGDVDHFCMKNGYFVHGINKDITKLERYSPGGKLLECEWRQKSGKVGLQ